jgi:uncharacterized protein YndB with AHSA1/START domain
MLFYPESFKMSTPTDLEIALERDFNAPRQLVFDAFTKPELVRRTVLYGSREARDTATRSGMEHGMVAGYNRLEELLASFGAKA